MEPADHEQYIYALGRYPWDWPFLRVIAISIGISIDEFINNFYLTILFRSPGEISCDFPAEIRKRLSHLLSNLVQ